MQNQTVVPNVAIPTTTLPPPVPPAPPAQPPTQFKITEPSSSKFPTGFIVFLLLVVVAGAGAYLGRNNLTSIINNFSKPIPQPTIAVASPSAMPTTNLTATSGATAATPSAVLSPTLATASPTIDPTVNWKNLVLGGVCEFKYPPAWSFSKTSAPLGMDAMVQCGDGTCAVEYNVDLFQVTPLIYKTVDEYIEKNTIKSDYAKITLNGIEGVKAAISGGPQAGGSMIEVFFVYKNQGYAANYRFIKLYDKTKLTDFPVPNPDILSTLKFL